MIHKLLIKKKFLIRIHDSPKTVIRNATKYEVMPIHKIHIINVRLRNRGYFRQSGIVNQRTVVIGHLNRKAHRLVPIDRFHGLSANSKFYHSIYYNK